MPIPAGQAGYLIATAARAPSVQNTQPWQFHISEYVIELYADPSRKLKVDPVGRELLSSCGAALFGLRLAVRSLVYLPVAELLPDPARPRLLARVTLGKAEPITPACASYWRHCPTGTPTAAPGPQAHYLPGSSPPSNTTRRPKAPS